MPDISKLQQLLQDRNDKARPAGRASAPFPVILDADLAIDLSKARQELQQAEEAVKDWEAEAKQDARQSGRRKVPAELTAAVAEAKARVEELQAEADEVKVQLIFVALRADENDELEKQHPPREGNDDDKKWGFNADTFPVARMHECAARVVDMDNNLLDLDPKKIVTGFSQGERDFAVQVVNGVNAQLASVPFYDANSQSRQRSGGKSRRR
jgi:seryl-tRNA synthetase